MNSADIQVILLRTCRLIAADIQRQRIAGLDPLNGVCGLTVGVEVSL
jgi:hypothetical protein